MSSLNQHRKRVYVKCKTSSLWFTGFASGTRDLCKRTAARDLFTKRSDLDPVDRHDFPGAHDRTVQSRIRLKCAQMFSPS